MEAQTRSPLHVWVLNHDDSWLFIALYIGLAVVLSLAISLFWLVVVVAAHAALEWYVHWREHPSIVHTAARVAWEIKLDMALVVFALALGVYMEFVMGVAGLSAAARGAQATGRFVAWQRALRGILLTVDDAAQVARAASGRGSADDVEVPKEGWGGWTSRWTFGDRFSLAFGVACLLLIVISPWLTGMGVTEVLDLLAAEMDPWPSDH
jgi:hypothetical protein